MTTQFFSFAIFNIRTSASSPHIPPVGLDGEFNIRPLTSCRSFDIKSSKSASKLFSAIVLTNIGSASARRINSGNDTQYGLNTRTLSP